MATRVALGVPQASVDLPLLADLRRRLGDDSFRTPAAEHLDAGSAGALFAMLDEAAAQE